MNDAVTDTHGLIWYLEDSPRLSRNARRVFDACDRNEISILVPTICLVEMLYLQEKGRIPANLTGLLDHELASGSTGLALYDLTPEIARDLALVPRDAVPDMPDRIIAATAVHLGLPLISRDGKIRVSDVETIW